MRVLDARLHDWGLPAYQTAGAAAVDLHACVDTPVVLLPGEAAVLIPAGFAMHIAEPGMAALILPRSGLGHRKGLVLGNTAGLIDSDYTGPILVSAWNRGTDAVTVQPGERFAQMVFVPVIRANLMVAEAFTGASARGSGGFGSTG